MPAMIASDGEACRLSSALQQRGNSAGDVVGPGAARPSEGPEPHRAGPRDVFCLAGWVKPPTSGSEAGLGFLLERPREDSFNGLSQLSTYFCNFCTWVEEPMPTHIAAVPSLVWLLAEVVVQHQPEAGPQAQERPVAGHTVSAGCLEKAGGATAAEASPQHRNRAGRNTGLPSKSLEPQKAN